MFKQGMKGPNRPAPSVPGLGTTRYSPVTNWNDDPFGADVFEPTPHYMQKKKPPPRPPPPKVNAKQPDVPLKPSHFIRRPTVLSSLLSRKNKTSNNQNVNPNINSQHLISDFNGELDTNKMFPKCEPKIVQTGTLIDLSSPPSSPTFTTRSSSDGLSVDSFGSDATTSTNHHNILNGGNASQAESGFEDDFDFFLHSRKNITKEDTLDDLSSIDPFSPQPMNKPPIMKKPPISKDLFDISSNIPSQTGVGISKGPTIIRAKPARPKPPENSALLKTTFGDSFPVTSMNVNISTPIQKVSNGFENFESKQLNWDEESSPEREWSPPMPSVPPPPPPPPADDDLSLPCPLDRFPDDVSDSPEPTAEGAEEEYAVALFDYFTDHPDDLCFSAGSKIKLIRRIDAEWLYGSLRGGAEGVFPANYVELNALAATPPRATALYDFTPDQPGDLPFRVKDTITVIHKINDEWYFGECNGIKGQFPVNYVQMG